MTSITRPLDVAAIAAYSDEVGTSAPAILDAIARAQRDPADLDAVHEAFRLIHALKGAASMVGLPALSHLLNQAEELLDKPVTERRPLDDDVITLLQATMPAFKSYVDAARRGECDEQVALRLSRAYRAYMQPEDDSEDPMLRELLELERVGFATTARATEATGSEAGEEAGRAAQPELDLDELFPTEPVPPELAEVFALEAQEQLQNIARLTGVVAAVPDDRESLQELRRAVHTVKGAAGIVGYKAASRLAHRMEDLLDRLYEGTEQATPASTRLLAISSDALDDLISAAPEKALELRGVLVRLLGEYDQLVGTAPAPPAAAESVLEEAIGQEPASEAPSDVAAAMPVAPPAPRTPERRRGADRRREGSERRRSGAQVVRVPFERLGELIRSVSELVINRSSFDQHYAGLIEQVDELKLSTARLRRLALKLETDYEVRALAGNIAVATEAGASGAGHGFDELEFDRYTDFHLLSRELTETASDINTINTRLSETIGNFDGDLTRLGRLTREVQDKVMEFRMVPLVTLASRLERAVRVTAEECGKAVDLVLEGENVALDKTLLEEMSDPLLHLLRNAVDHGIETPMAREAAGKPARGRIAVRAYHEGTDVLLEVEDDGAGLDIERIRQTAMERGYVSEAEGATMTSEALTSLVFEPGFTTAQRLSEVSGRGVGMDIVRSKVNRLGGRVTLASRAQGGTTVTVRVPMTMAITRILLVRAGGQTVGLPLGAVAQIARPEAAAVTAVGSDPIVNVDGRTYPLRDLATLLNLPRSVEGISGRPILIANLGGHHMALVVDEIVQSRDAVVKTLGTHLRRVQGIWGATLLGDGTVILILNPADLAGVAEEPRVRHAAPRAAAAAEPQAYTVLVVDDSLSMRHVLSNAIKRAGWNPVQARDGVDALELMHRSSDPPDLILLDIEMPRMDGYEFLSTIRAQAPYAGVPIVMLTSRGGDKHREKAMALGATDYIVKPFQEDPLLQKLSGLIRTARAEQRKAS